jgi:hypothetical protein
VARGPNVSGSSHLAPSYLGATIPRRLVVTVAAGMCPSRHPVLRTLSRATLGQFLKASGE